MSSFVDLAIKIDRLMRMINAELNPMASEFDREKVGPIGGMLLLTLGDAEPLNLRAIITRMGRDKSQITRLVQSLERKGLVAKERCSEDARELVLRLTPKGRQQLVLIQNALAGIVETIVAPLSPIEMQQFSVVLDRLVNTTTEGITNQRDQA